MSRPPDHRLPAREVTVLRPLGVAALAVLLAVGAHRAAGGAVPPSGEVLLAAVGLAVASTWSAREIGRRTRGLSASAVLVGAGQGGLELLLRIGGRGVVDPLLAVGLHAGAALLLVVLGLGVDRVAGDVRAAADRSWPLLGRSSAPEPADRRGPLRVPAREGGAGDVRWWPERCPVRGPPLAL